MVTLRDISEAPKDGTPIYITGGEIFSDLSSTAPKPLDHLMYVKWVNEPWWDDPEDKFYGGRWEAVVFSYYKIWVENPTAYVVIENVEMVLDGKQLLSLIAKHGLTT